MKSLLFGFTVLILLILSGCGSSNKDITATDNEMDESISPPIMVGATPPVSDLTHMIDYTSKSWMAQINDDVSIADITMTGTHDSATYNYEKSNNVGAHKYVMTQNKSITEQLNMGVRVFDLRVKIDKSNGYVGMTHDTYDLGIGFQTVLIYFKNFLKANPSEALIIIIKKEDTPDFSDRHFAIRVWDKMVGMNKSLSHFYLKENIIPTLGELRGKMLVLRRFDIGDLKREYGTHITHYSKEDKGDYHKSSEGDNTFRYYVQDWWKIDYNNNYKDNPSDDVWTKLGYVEDVIDSALEDNKNRLYLNYASCTDVSSGSDFVGSHGVDTLADAIKPELDKYVKGKKGVGHGGVVMVDFAEDWLVKHITQINSVNFEPWTKRYKIDEHFGTENSGGGIAIGDIDGDGINNLVISYMDNPQGENSYYIRISSNIKEDGTVQKWGPPIHLAGHYGSENSGVGLAIGDTDGDGINNLVISFIDNPQGENSYYYENLGNFVFFEGPNQWLPTASNGIKKIDGDFGAENSGAGIAIGDTDGDGINNLVISFIDNPENENTMYYQTSSNLNKDATVDTWNDREKIDVHIGAENSGAGIAIADIDGDGYNNLIISYIDNPNGENQAYYRVSSNIDDGEIISWSEPKKIYGHFGAETDGAGITIGNVDNINGSDLILYYIDNPDGENRGYYKVGFNVE